MVRVEKIAKWTHTHWFFFLNTRVSEISPFLWIQLGADAGENMRVDIGNLNNCIRGLVRGIREFLI